MLSCFIWQMLGAVISFVWGALFAVGNLIPNSRNEPLNHEMEVTASERQLLDILRETHVDGFKLVIERDGGAWEVTLSGQLPGKRRKSLGVGASFSEAWNKMLPWWS